MSRHETPPFYVDHVGSLLRSPQLLQAYRKQESGEITSDELRSIQDDEIDEAIALQESSGISTITDGEFRRVSWLRGFSEALGIFRFEPGPLMFRNSDGPIAPLVSARVDGKAKRSNPIVGDDYDFLKTRTSGRIKMTLPSPSMFHFGVGDKGVDSNVYPDVEEYFSDLVEVYHEEINDLAARGCSFVQLDEVPLALLCDLQNQEILRADGQDPEKLIDLYVDLNRRVVENVPEGVAVTMHLCRGNHAGMWAGVGGYEPIAERLFNEVAVDGFLLEYESDRAGDLTPLRHMPKGRAAILGLLSTKNPELESVDSLARRVDEASQYVDIADLGICPQCGFASSATPDSPRENPMTADAQRRKLALLVETAGTIWD